MRKTLQGKVLLTLLIDESLANAFRAEAAHNQRKLNAQAEIIFAAALHPKRNTDEHTAEI